MAQFPLTTGLASRTLQQGERLDYTPSAAKSAGDIVQLFDDVIGGVDEDIAASKQGSLDVTNIRVAKNSSVAWSVGDDVYWDATNEQAVASTSANADYYLGVCPYATDSDSPGVPYIPRLVSSREGIIRSIPLELDCSTAGDTADHVIIPAALNLNGLQILYCFARISEAMAGDTEDQGELTVEDEDGNTLSVIAVSDAGADSVGDVAPGTFPVYGATLGAAIKTVAAGKAVTVKVSQQTSGTGEAGKMVVYVLATPLV